MRRDVLLALALSVSGLTACASGPRYLFTSTTHEAAQPLPMTCSVELFSTRPERHFVELGVLEFNSSSQGAVHTAGEFLTAVQVPTCQVGGNAILTEINGFGYYVRGTVIRWVDSGVSGGEAPSGTNTR